MARNNIQFFQRVKNDIQKANNNLFKKIHIGDCVNIYLTLNTLIWSSSLGIAWSSLILKSSMGLTSSQFSSGSMLDSLKAHLKADSNFLAALFSSFNRSRSRDSAYNLMEKVRRVLFIISRLHITNKWHGTKYMFTFSKSELYVNLTFPASSEADLLSSHTMVAKSSNEVKVVTSNDFSLRISLIIFFSSWNLAFRSST